MRQRSCCSPWWCYHGAIARISYKLEFIACYRGVELEFNTCYRAMELQYGAQLLCHFLAFHGVPLGNHPIHNKIKHVQEIFIELLFVLNSCLVEKLCIAENSNLKLHMESWSSNG